MIQLNWKVLVVRITDARENQFHVSLSVDVHIEGIGMVVF